MADVTVESGDFIITSSGESEDAIRAAMSLGDEPADTPAAPAQEATPEESASDDAPVEHTPDAKADEDAPKKLDKRTKAGRQAAIQQEIDALIAQRTEARKALEAEKAQLEALRAPQAKSGDDPEPQESEFDDYGKYVKAQARWEARQEFRAQQQATYEAQQAALAQREIESRTATFSAKMQEASAKTPGFLDTIRPELLELRPFSALQPGETGDASNALAEEILRSERPAELLRYLSDHPEDVQRLVTLPPQEFLRQMARIDVRLDAASDTAAPVSKTPPLSQAKPPIRAMGSVPSAGDDGELSDDLPVEEYIRRANALDRQKRFGR